MSELGTNAARAMGTNAVADHTWGQMSSLGYKQLKEEQVALRDHDKDLNPIDLYNPLTGKYDHKFTAPKSFLSHADTGQHLGDRPVPSQQLGR